MNYEMRAREKRLGAGLIPVRFNKCKCYSNEKYALLKR
jgi:hypothetical protein